MQPGTEIETLVSRLRKAKRVTVVTGSGVSAASGVPTFRGEDGLWRGFRVEEVATAEAFARDARLVWEFYDWRRQVCSHAVPNRAHEVLAAWSLRFPAFTLVTQNVDGLHERAGTRNVVRFHGSLWEVACWEGCRPGRWADQTVPFPELPPRCLHCGGPLRPGVVWFGEAIEPVIFESALRALDCDLCLVVGTSSAVYPAAGLSLEARRRGAFLAEVNLERTPASGLVDLAIGGRAEEILDRIERLLAPPPAPVSR